MVLIVERRGFEQKVISVCLEDFEGVLHLGCTPAVHAMNVNIYAQQLHRV